MSTHPFDREAWLKVATQYMDNRSDINMATIQFHVLMDQIDKLAGLALRSRDFMKDRLCFDGCPCEGCQLYRDTDRLISNPSL